MMTNHQILNDVNAEPFRPFQNKIISGDTYEIRHPEMIQVGRTTCTIFTWMSEDNNDPKEREREISMLLIESIEPLQPVSSTDPSQN